MMSIENHSRAARLALHAAMGLRSIERYSFVDAIHRYQEEKRDEEHWITVGGKMGGDGKRHGGHPVQIDEKGDIVSSTDDQKKSRPAHTLESELTKHVGLIKKIGKSYAIDDKDLDDFVSDVHMAAWKNRDRFDEGRGRLTTWLGTIAKRQAMRLHRDRTRAKRGGGVQPVSIDTQADDDSKLSIANLIPDHRDSSQSSDRRAMMKKVRSHLSAFPRSQQRAIVGFLRGQSSQQIADDNGITRQAVEASLKGAVKRLQELMHSDRDSYAAFLFDAEIHHYARKNQDGHSLSLFDDDGNAAHWITVGGEPGPDGAKHGGHPVKIDGSGKMLTGAFEGKTLDEAFGKESKRKPKDETPSDSNDRGKKFGDFLRDLKAIDIPQATGFTPPDRQELKQAHLKARAIRDEASKIVSEDELKTINNYISSFMPGEIREQRNRKDPFDFSVGDSGPVFSPRFTKVKPAEAVKPTTNPQEPGGIIVPQATTANDQAKSGDQLGLFGEATKAKPVSKAFVPTILGQGETSKAKQTSMFDTDDHPDQMRLFGDGSESARMVAKLTEDTKQILKSEKTKTSDEPRIHDPIFHEKGLKAGKLGFTSVPPGLTKGTLPYASWLAGNKQGIEERNADTKTEKVSVPLSDSIQLATAFTDRIQDFGEKIGGARKDTAMKTGPRGSKVKAEDEDKPTGWRSRYHVYQIAKSTNKSEEGKWAAVDKKQKDWTGQPKQVGVYSSKEEADKALALHEVARNHGVYNKASSKEPPNWEIYRRISDRKRPTIKDGFKSQAEASAFMAAHPEEIINHETNITDAMIHPAIANVTRKGEDRRGGRQASAESFKKYGFRGVEFGNWNNNAETREILNHAEDSFDDLSKLLGLKSEDMSLGGQLGLGFGSRGHGLSSAKAHYERDYVAINLTKLKGAGSLAHEWAHALDHYLGRQSGKGANERNSDGRIDSDAFDYVSHGHRRNLATGYRPELKEAFDNVMDKILHKITSFTADATKQDAFHKRTTNTFGNQLDEFRSSLANDHSKDTYKPYRGAKNNVPLSADKMKEVDQIISNLKSQAETGFTSDLKELPSNRLSGGHHVASELHRLDEIYKEHRGRRAWGYSQSGRFDGRIAELHRSMEALETSKKQLDAANANEVKTRRVRTDFHNEAKSMDEGRVSDYWSEPHELFARAFDSYVFDKMKRSGEHNDFLSHEKHNETLEAKMLGVKPFPEKEEKKEIDGAIDKFLESLRAHKHIDQPEKQRYSHDGGDTIFYSFDSSKHPRIPKDDPSSKGGEFTDRKYSEVTKQSDFELLQNILDMKPIDVKDVAIGSNEARVLYEKVGKTATSDGKPVTLVKGIFGKIARHRDSNTILKIIPSLEPLIKSSRYAWSEKERNPSKNPNIFAFHNYISRFRLSDHDYFVRFTVQEVNKPDGRELHNMALSNIEITKAATSGNHSWIIDQAKSTGSSFDRTLAEWMRKVKDQHSKVSTDREKDQYSFSVADRPTEAQLLAGNYRKKHMNMHGLRIAIETPKGFRRHPEWPRLAADYGDIKGTTGRDGDAIDVFVGSDPKSELVYVIDQVSANGRFDEHKAMLGFSSQQKAIDAYKRCYSPGWKIGPVTAMTIQQFRTWLKEGNHRKKLSDQVSRYSASDDLRLESDDHFETMRYSFYSALKDRYEWSESLHPRQEAGRPEGGQFKAVDASHHLHTNKLPQNIVAEHERLHANLMDTLGSQFLHGNELQSAEAWRKVDKNRVQSILDGINKLDHQSRTNGVAYSDHVNASQTIPHRLVAKLAGGSRFFDQQKIAGKLQSPPTSSKQPATSADSSADRATTTSESNHAFSTRDKAATAKQIVPKYEIAHLSKIGSNKLDSEIKSLLGSNDPGKIAAFREIVDHAWQTLKEERQRQNEVVRYLGGEGKRVGGLVNFARNGRGDQTPLRKFDEAVQEAAWQWPDQFGGTGHLDDQAMAILRRGVQTMPKIYDGEVIDRAMNMAGSAFFESDEDGHHEHVPKLTREELDAIPFSWWAAKEQIETWKYSHSRFRSDFSVDKVR